MKHAIGTKTFSFLMIVGMLLPLGPCLAQEYFPPGIEIIDPPFDYVDRINWVSRTEDHLIVVGLGHSPTCPSYPVYCPSLHFYERPEGRWELQQTVEFAETGLAAIMPIGPNKVALRRSKTRGGSQTFEIEEYNLDPISGQWEGTVVSQLRPGGMAYSDGTYLLACEGINCGKITFVDNINGEWQETDVLYLSSIRVFNGYTVTEILVQNGLAYVLFCEHTGSCSDNRGIAIIDVPSRTVIDYLEIQNPGILALSLFGDQMLIAAHDLTHAQPYLPTQIYENIAGIWTHVDDVSNSFEWSRRGFNIAQTDETLFDEKSPTIGSNPVDAFVFYQRNASSEWEQHGAILIPTGNGVMRYSYMAGVFGQAVYVVEGTTGSIARILEVTNYHDYLDRDEDIMPQWWEEMYGFSPDAYNDFENDTDQDGLSDIEEYGYLTSPVSHDTDNDQMSDDWELQYAFDPRDASDADLDFDQDGYSNQYEYLNGMDPHFRDGAADNSQPPYTRPQGGGGSTDLLWAFILLIGSLSRLLGAGQISEISRST